MRDEQYWIDRAINSLVVSEKSVIDFETGLLKAYEYADIEIKKEISNFYSKNAVITDSKYNLAKKPSLYVNSRKRLDEGEMKRFVRLIGHWQSEAEQPNMSPEYKEYLNKMSKLVYVTRLQELESAIRREVELIKSKQFGGMKTLLTNNFEYTYYNSNYEFSKAFEQSVIAASLTDTTIEQAVSSHWNGNNFSKSVWSDRDKLVTVLQQLLPSAMAQGASDEELGTRIAKEMNTSKNRGIVLARTETNYIHNQARLKLYEQLGIDEYLYIATLDLRTSDTCRALDGSTWKLSQSKIGVNYPPMHPQCRSTTIPNIHNLSAFRNAVDGEGKHIYIPRTMTQEEYIKQYAPKEKQEQLLRFLKSYTN